MNIQTQIQPTLPIATISPLRTEELLNKFIFSQDVKQSSKDLYRRTLKQYFTRINKKGYQLSEIALPQIIEYKEDLLSSGMSSLTVGSYVTAVRRFYEWAEANKFYPNVAKGIKNPKRKQQFRKQPLTVIQTIALIDSFKEKNIRDYAVINLLLRTGLRTIEVIRANVGDIVFKGSQRVLLIQGKGRDEKDRFVILTDKTYKPIAEYLATRTATEKDPLFISTSNNSKGDRLTTRTISYIAKEGLKGIGLNEKSYSAHSLRHSAIVNCRRAGGTPEQAQALAGHSSPATTQLYDSYFRDEDRLQNSGEALIDGLF